MKNEKGFSLVELLVVVIIIAIIAAIAIPNLLASRRAANEASAIQSMRTIHSAQATYFALNGNAYGTMTDLSAATVELLDPTFTGAAITKSGYDIAVSINTDADEYCADALPDGATNGTRVFGTDERGVVYEGLTAAQPCASGVLDTSGGTVIQ